ncbi:hypothetical protein EG835_00555 [bacterium]|nr:hypothetical protein [bacterium]
MESGRPAFGRKTPRIAEWRAPGSIIPSANHHEIGRRPGPRAHFHGPQAVGPPGRRPLSRTRRNRKEAPEMKVLRPGLLLLLVLVVASSALGQSQVAAPEMRPPGGPIQGSSMSVTIQCSTSGATIFYTTNGNDPTPDSQRYQPGASITVDRPMTIKAKAYKFGMADSRVSVATYIKSAAAGAPGGQVSGQVADPQVTPPTGEFTGGLTITARTSTSGAEIRYTKDGSVPTLSSPRFPERESINATTIVKFRAFKQGMNPSNVVERRYTLGKLAQVADPVVKPENKSFGIELEIEVSTSTSGADVRYTMEGADPTVTSPIAPKKIKITGSTTFKARAFKVGMNPSNVVVRRYVKDTSLAPTPTPAKGVVTPAERAKSAEECNRIQNLQKEIDRIKAERANRRRALGLDPDPDCRMK